MSTTPPARRFLPQPEETTTSHRRRFAPEPIETTTKSNYAKHATDSPGASPDTSRRKFLPEPVEATSKSHRGKGLVHTEEIEIQPGSPRKRFLPEPVEASSKSHRAPKADSSDNKAGFRKFKIEPLETTKTHKGRRASEEDEEVSPTAAPIRRFKPEPVETSAKSSRKDHLDSTEASSGPKRKILPQPVEESTKTSRRKKFSPQLIETASRSRRIGDTEPAIQPHDRTERSPVDETHPRPTRPSITPLISSDTPFDSSEDVPQVEESRFSSASLSRKQTRSHSFRVPSLPSIASNEEESDESGVPSLSNSDSADSNETQHASRLRESCDERFSGYLLQLAARAAEKQLKDQAMAAYPNEKDHEPVDHFAIDRDEDSEDEAKADIISREDIDIAAYRRESAADLGWELREMRKHQKKLSQEKQARKEKDEAEWMTKPKTQGPFQSAAQSAKQAAHANDASDGPKNIIGGWQKGVGLPQMRNAASPPMLGNDLVFPKSLSPKATRLDVDQFPVPGKHAGEETTPTNDGQLWLKNAKSKQSNAGSGLWMGCCAKAQHHDANLLTPPKTMKSGIITPLPERSDSIPDADVADVNIPIFDMRGLPPSPPSSQTDGRLDGIDRMLHVENEIDNEFNDAFVTQIYNYLSLGYPSLARKFDGELSKISRVSIEDLRRDDQMTNAKGYVGAPEGDGAEDNEVTGGRCARWTALRLYVREWARQQPGMADHKTGLDAWGVRARRGSWAI
jgi:hypothetical protein